MYGKSSLWFDQISTVIFKYFISQVDVKFVGTQQLLIALSQTNISMFIFRPDYARLLDVGLGGLV